MSLCKKFVVMAALFALCSMHAAKLEAVSYVTDTGGYAYDESRAAVNLAPAIALGTVAIVGIVAIAVQNSHDHHSSGCFNHNDYRCSSGSGSYSSCPYYYYYYYPSYCSHY